MADETTTTWANLMREAKGPLQEALKYKTVLLSEIKRDQNPRRWNGKQITIPIFTAPQQGTGGLTQSAALNNPETADTIQTVINTGIVAIAISFTTQVLNQAKGDENVWAEVMPTKMQRAEDAFGRVINEMMMTGDGGDGSVDAGDNGLLAKATGVTGASGGLTQAVAVGTSANWYQLYVGRVVDVLTRASGATVFLECKVSSRNKTAGTVTFANIDGVSNCSFATAATDGIYIQGSRNTSIQGLPAAVATSGTFQNVNKANVTAWQGTDASPSAATDPSIALYDRAERQVYENSGRQPDFYMADPAVVDKYTQGLTVQARWAGEDGQLESGWTGVRYRNKLIVPDFDMPASTSYGIQKEDMAIYTIDNGPDWDDNTGSILQRFGTRALPVEAWLVWMLQLGFQSCNGLVQIRNQNRAA